MSKGFKNFVNVVSPYPPSLALSTDQHAVVTGDFYAVRLSQCWASLVKERSAPRPDKRFAAALVPTLHPAGWVRARSCLRGFATDDISEQFGLPVERLNPRIEFAVLARERVGALLVLRHAYSAHVLDLRAHVAILLHSRCTRDLGVQLAAHRQHVALGQRVGDRALAFKES